MELPMSVGEYDICNKKWRAGTLIQDAFPMLTVDQREFLMTGATPEEWNACFSDC
jgi:hypothetical protein